MDGRGDHVLELLVVETRRDVEDGALGGRDGQVAVDRGDLSFCIEGGVDGGIGLAGKQPVERSGRAIAENGGWPGELQGGVLTRERRGVAMAHEMDAAPDRDQPLAPDAVLDRPRVDALAHEVLVRHHSPVHQMDDYEVDKRVLVRRLPASPRLPVHIGVNLGLAGNHLPVPRLPPRRPSGPSS